MASKGKPRVYRDGGLWCVHWPSWRETSYTYTWDDALAMVAGWYRSVYGRGGV